MIEIELPFPPSVNTYWGTRVLGTGKRKFVQRYINPAGKKFRQSAIEICVATRASKGMEGFLACEIDLHPPCLRRRDCDNFAKGVLDALQHAGIYADDCQIKDLRIRMFPKKPGGATYVRLKKIDTE